MDGAGSSVAKRLAAAILAGDQLALARAMTMVENQTEDSRKILTAIASKTGQARVIGFTGPPGAGKSTLVDAIISAWRAKGERIAVLAVDPVSPISGGAVLGDRTRMGAHSLDEGVFIRSISSRGHLGGLSAATHSMAELLDAAGWPLILIETVGAGQSEVDIAKAADLSVVISAPGLGDDVQAIKAGILEIADILVVNKADRDDASQTARQLEKMLLLRAREYREVPVMKVSGTTGLGVEDLHHTLMEKLAGLTADPGARREAYKRLVMSQALARDLVTQLPNTHLPEPGSEGWVNLIDVIVRQITAK